MSVLIMIDRDVENGKYIEGYLTDFFDPNKSMIVGGDKVYQCYIPNTGKIARVPEMSRYFFFVQLEKYKPDITYITSPICHKLIDDDKLLKSISFTKKSFNFEVMYQDNKEESDDLVLVSN